MLNRRLIVGVSLLVIGIGLVVYLKHSQMLSSSVAASSVVTAPVALAPQPASVGSTSQTIQGEPVELQIPSLNMDLPIIPGYYNSKTQTWTLTTNKVQYATITPSPNNVEGNTFLYGHYRSEVFARLHTISANAQAVVKTANDHTFYYQLSSVRTTTPGDTSVLAYTGKPILTIQTCTGLFFQYRQLFTFNLQQAT